MNVCPNCGAENPQGFRFCGSCGAALAEATPRAGGAQDRDGALLRRRRLDGVRRARRPALERAQEVTSVDDIADVVGLGVLEAVLRARCGDLEEAQDLASQALARVEETDHVGLRLDTRWNAAEVFELAGRGDEATALLEESVEIAERYGHLVAAGRARERLDSRSRG